MIALYAHTTEHKIGKLIIYSYTVTLNNFVINSSSCQDLLFQETRKRLANKDSNQEEAVASVEVTEVASEVGIEAVSVAVEVIEVVSEVATEVVSVVHPVVAVASAVVVASEF